jgi:hypothetical protein
MTTIGSRCGRLPTCFRPKTLFFTRKKRFFAEVSGPDSDQVCPSQSPKGDILRTFRPWETRLNDVVETITLDSGEVLFPAIRVVHLLRRLLTVRWVNRIRVFARQPHKAGSESMAAKKQNDQQQPKDEKKSDAVRRVFNAMKEAGTEPKPVDVQRTLVAEGISVSAAQISQVLKKLREGTPAKGKKELLFSLTDLVAAKKFIGKIGSPKKAKELIDALGSK